MLDFGLETAKKWFFDGEAVMRRVKPAVRKFLSRAGAFVRTTARQSIRPGKRPARPGNPPKSHTGHLRRFILFFVDPQQQSVIIGPVRLNDRATGGDAPELLEKGGTARRKRKQTSGDGYELVTARYRPHPYMGPALEREKPKLDPLWADSIH